MENPQIWKPANFHKRAKNFSIVHTQAKVGIRTLESYGKWEKNEQSATSGRKSEGGDYFVPFYGYFTSEIFKYTAKIDSLLSFFTKLLLPLLLSKGVL